MTGDPRDRRPKFDLYKVDFNWVAKETSKKELKGAYYALLEDKGYPDLLKAVRDRLKTLDPKFKTAEDFNNVTPAEEAAATGFVSEVGHRKFSCRPNILIPFDVPVLFLFCKNREIKNKEDR